MNVYLLFQYFWVTLYMSTPGFIFEILSLYLFTLLRSWILTYFIGILRNRIVKTLRKLNCWSNVQLNVTLTCFVSFSTDWHITQIEVPARMSSIAFLQIIRWIQRRWLHRVFSSDFSRSSIIHPWLLLLLLLLLLGHLFSYFNFSGKWLDGFGCNFAGMFSILLLNYYQILNEFEIVVWDIFAFFDS